MATLRLKIFSKNSVHASVQRKYTCSCIKHKLLFRRSRAAATVNSINNPNKHCLINIELLFPRLISASGFEVMDINTFVFVVVYDSLSNRQLGVTKHF